MTRACKIEPSTRNPTNKNAKRARASRSFRDRFFLRDLPLAVSGLDILFLLGLPLPGFRENLPLVLVIFHGDARAGNNPAPLIIFLPLHFSLRRSGIMAQELSGYKLRILIQVEGTHNLRWQMDGLPCLSKHRLDSRFRGNDELEKGNNAWSGIWGFLFHFPQPLIEAVIPAKAGIQG